LQVEKFPNPLIPRLPRSWMIATSGTKDMIEIGCFLTYATFTFIANPSYFVSILAEWWTVFVC
jgi:hypothetical protein